MYCSYISGERNPLPANGLLILMACVHWFGWIPIYTTPPATLWDELLLYSIPAAAVGFRSSALMMRLTRSSMLEVLRQDYIRTARAKGASERRVALRHQLRNALLSFITLFGLAFPFLLTGAVLIETIFAWPGMGRLATDAILRRDFPVVNAAVLLASTMVVAVMPGSVCFSASFGASFVQNSVSLENGSLPRSYVFWKSV